MSVIKVLIVDDSAFIRAVLTEILSKVPGVQVVGTAGDPILAMEKIKKLDPDVITLDLEMPRMDGLTFLHQIMATDPRPVVMISSWTPKNSEQAVKALELGAFDCIAKPTLGLKEGMEGLKAEIGNKVLSAALARYKLKPGKPRTESAPMVKSPVMETSDKVIAIGASTGGTVAITEVLRHLPATLPGIIIIQHMPEFFTAAFAKSLDENSPIHVREARDGERLMSGQAVVAPGNHHLRVERQGAMYYLRVTQEAHVNLHRPSVDVTFQTVATAAGANAMGVLLTGMGEDGARGLLAMRQAGAYTVAQDEATSVVYGMPKRAADLGAVDKIRPLANMADEIQGWARKQRKGVEI